MLVCDTFWSDLAFMHWWAFLSKCLNCNFPISATLSTSMMMNKTMLDSHTYQTLIWRLQVSTEIKPPLVVVTKKNAARICKSGNDTWQNTGKSRGNLCVRIEQIHLWVIKWKGIHCFCIYMEDKNVCPKRTINLTVGRNTDTYSYLSCWSTLWVKFAEDKRYNKVCR